MLTVSKYYYNCRRNIELQCSENSNSKFLDCHILNFYEKYVLPTGQLPTLINHTQQVVSIFDSRYCCEQLYSKIKHVKSMLYLQLSNHHLFDVLLQSTSSFNPDIRFLGSNNIRCLINNNCYHVNLAVFSRLFKIVVPDPPGWLGFFV